MKDLGLKWHVLGRLTIIYILVFACAIIPVTASKYVSQAEGSSSARVARFEGGTVESNGTLEVDLTKVNGIPSDLHYYAFAASFTVNFDEADVTRAYTLILDIVPVETISSDQTTTFACPANYEPFTINLTNSTVISGKDVFPHVTGLSSGGFTEGKASYIIDNTCYTADVDADGRLIFTGVIPAGESKVSNYKVLYFVPITQSSAESDIIAYDLACEQVD